MEGLFKSNKIGEALLCPIQRLNTGLFMVDIHMGAYPVLL
jgi:hypothetical protein